LPHCIFAHQKSQFGNAFEGFGMESVGIFYIHLVFFWPFGILLAIWYILWPIYVFCGHLVDLSTFWYVALGKHWYP
jgi:hypothetical protein